MSQAIHGIRGPVAVFGIPLPCDTDAWKHYKNTKFPLPSSLESSELGRHRIGQAGRVHTHLTEICEHIFPDVRIQIGFRRLRSERVLVLVLVASTCKSDAFKPSDEDICKVKEVLENEGFGGVGEPGWFTMIK
jgi:hypothetical protein